MEKLMDKRKIWKTDVLGIGPYVVDTTDGSAVLCTVKNHQDAQEIANIPAMTRAIVEAMHYLSDDPAQLKLSKEDLLDVLGHALSYREI